MVMSYCQKLDEIDSAAARFGHHLVKPVNTERLLALLASLSQFEGGAAVVNRLLFAAVQWLQTNEGTISQPTPMLSGCFLRWTSRLLPSRHSALHFSDQLNE